MKILLKTKKAEREAHAKRLTKLQKDSDRAENAYDSKRKAFEKAAKEHADAVAKAEGANRDQSIAPVKLKKFEGEAVSHDKKEQMAKADYDLAQAHVETFRTQYYTVDIRKVFNDMQKMEMERELAHADQLIAYAKAYTAVHKTVGACLEGATEAAQSIKWTTDSTRFVERTKTGIPPESRITATVSTKKMVTAQQVNSKRVSKHKLFKTTSRKKDAIRSDLAHLTPHQRERALREKLAELSNRRDKEAKAKTGFEKTIEAYTKNPAMGDKKSKDKLQKELDSSRKQLTEIDQEIVKLTLYLEAYEDTKEGANEEDDWDDDEEGAVAGEDGGDDDDEDGSGAEPAEPTKFETAIALPPTLSSPAAPAVAPVTLPPPCAEVPTLPPAPPSPPEADLSAPPPAHSASADQRKSVALYAFDGTGETEITVAPQEPVTVTEEDIGGSGWVRVMNSMGDEGYVPASYIK
jgi:cell fate (sporulation/competence/biofilm development) regulator YmcA (YheA/YmcA/DUF963 family)